MKYRYPFTNEIVFALVMQDEEICRGLLQLIFPDRKINKLKLHEPGIDIEKTIIVGIESRKVRLDVLFEGSREWYDIEMQCRNEHNVPKRSRYSHGIIDVNMLKPGHDFNELKSSYVIFLCCFDPFGQGEAAYQFRMTDAKIGLPLGDDSYTIILNSKAEEERTPEPLRELFRYINETQVAEGNKLLQEIDRSVGTWNTGKGLDTMVTWQQELSIREARAREAGLTEGRNEMIMSLIKAGAERSLIQEVSGLTDEEYMKFKKEFEQTKDER